MSLSHNTCQYENLTKRFGYPHKLLYNNMLCENISSGMIIVITTKIQTTLITNKIHRR
jgi:hypothetical protein